MEKRLEIGRTLNFFRSSAPKKFGAVIISKFRFKKVRFSDAVAAFGANFGPASAGSPFLTESLILAQNERWRRG